MTGSASHIAISRHHRIHRAGLIVIAAYKLLGALMFVLVGVGALKLLHKDVDDMVWHALVEVLHRNPESRVVNFLLEKAELLNDPLLKRIGFAAFSYAALGVLEAIGLYFEKIWGEFLTVVITASFLPIEIHEVVRRLTFWRAGLLATNILVVIYLLYLIGERAAHRAQQRMAAHRHKDPLPTAPSASHHGPESL